MSRGVLGAMVNRRNAAMVALNDVNDEIIYGWFVLRTHLALNNAERKMITGLPLQGRDTFINTCGFTQAHASC